jgi:hypothetical protein
MAASTQTEHAGFMGFYRNTFIPEHQHPANILLHVFGVAASAALIVFAVYSGEWAWGLLYPVVHAAPGLIGHRLFERNAEVGDIRLDRTDHPLWWFIIGNHLMFLDVLFGGVRSIFTVLSAGAVALSVGAIQFQAGETTLLARLWSLVAERIGSL